MPIRRRGVVVLLAWAIPCLLLGAAGSWRWWRDKDRGAVQRGWSVAESHGCFACHGAGGLQGFEDPGAGVGGVPAFSREDVEAYAKSEAEIREWILDGMPRRLREERAVPEAERPLLRMPAWRHVLSEGQVNDLVAYIKAASDFETPPDGPAEAGRQAASRLGCFGCHGPQGRGDLPNPRSFKGRIPAWDGPDFPEVAADDGEIREWILDGSPRRLREHPVARFFVRRQVVQMPAYRGRISEENLQRVLDYIHWLRRAPPNI